MSTVVAEDVVVETVEVSMGGEVDDGTMETVVETDDMDMELEAEMAAARRERPLFKSLRDEWEKMEFADVSIWCRGRMEVRSHRMILASLSPMLRKALERDPTKENDSVIVVPDVEAADLAEFLQNAYVGGTSEVRVSQAIEHLGLTDVMFNPYRPTTQLPVKMEMDELRFFADGKIEEDNLNYIQQGTFQDDDDGPDYEPEMEQYTAIEEDDKSRVKLQPVESVEERENQILFNRSQDVKPVPKAMRTKPGTSNVWRYFNLTMNKTKATCKTCDQKFKRGPGITSTLSRHLRTFHGELYEELQQYNQNEERTTIAPDLVEDDDEDDSGQRMHSKRSPVWQYFTHTPEEEKAVCNLCEKTFRVVMGASTHLVKHLEAKHPEEHDVVQQQKEEKRANRVAVEADSKPPSKVAVEMHDMKANPVWQYFEQDGINKIRCMECEAVVKLTGGNSTSLALRHIRKKHPELEGKENLDLNGTDVIWQFFDRKDRIANCMECNVPIVLNDNDVEQLIDHLKSTHKDSHDQFVDMFDQTSKKCIKLFANPTTARRKNALWNYFDSTRGRGNNYSCKACLEKVSCKPRSLNPLQRHLRVSHIRLYKQFLCDSGYTEEQAEEMAQKEPKKRGPKPQFEDDDPATRTCPHCGKIYSKRKGMLVHVEAVHSGKRPFVCSTCGMTFARKESFKRHTHDAIRPFLCSVCGKTFARRHIRDIHERAHYGDKRYPCSYCEKKFVTNQKKTIHERIHTGEKPFECKECGKKFVQRHQLQTHTRIHTGDRPYRCEHCNQMFRHLSTKAKHNCPGKPREGPTAVQHQIVRLPQAQVIPQGIEVYDTVNKETIII